MLEIYLSFHSLSVIAIDKETPFSEKVRLENQMKTLYREYWEIVVAARKPQDKK